MAQGRKTGGGSRKGIPNKATVDVKQAAQRFTTEAIDTLAKIMKDGESEAARVSAANAILDRGHGKAKQPLVGGDPEEGDNPILVSDRDRAKAIAALIAGLKGD